MVGKKNSFSWRKMRRANAKLEDFKHENPGNPRKMTRFFCRARLRTTFRGLREKGHTVSKNTPPVKNAHIAPFIHTKTGTGHGGGVSEAGLFCQSVMNESKSSGFKGQSKVNLGKETCVSEP